MRPFFLPAFLLLLSLFVAACDSGPERPPVPQIETTTFAPTLNVDLAQSTKTQSGLYYRDLEAGSGETPAVGDSISIRYTGWLANGAKFDEILPGETPYRFRLGGGRLIRGFEEGATGIKVGGRRQLIIPPALGYGERPPPGIPLNAILVFEVQVVRGK